jgi:eukaryotic-like serine/threonine-protein kinase
MAGRPARDAAPRYETLFRLAAGGMATVYVGTVRGALGFRQLVAIKKPHPHLLRSSDFRRELVTEARLASLLHHAHVVDVRDVEATDDGVSLIMDYVEGASLGELLQIASAGGPSVTADVAVRIVLDACTGLQAAHELCDERGRPLNLVHRDISPQNLLVGVDGVTRVADFGVAKFDRKSGQSTTDGNLKGKLAYMAPEYLRAEGVDRRLDIFAMGVVLWEALTGQRLFRGQHEADTLQRVLQHSAPPVSTIVPALGTGFDAIVDTALDG